MNIKLSSPSLEGAWDYYCGGCDLFFSVPSDKQKEVKYCPVCGWDVLIKNQEEFDKAYPHYKYRRVS